LGPNIGELLADQGPVFFFPLTKLLRKKSRGNTDFVKVIPIGLKKNAESVPA